MIKAADLLSCDIQKPFISMSSRGVLVQERASSEEQQTHACRRDTKQHANPPYLNA